MRYRLVILLLPLSGAIPLMDAMKVPAAPAPEVCGILDIGPPPKGKSMREHCEEQTRGLKNLVSWTWMDPKVKKLFSIRHAEANNAIPWMEKNFRVRPDESGRRLRLTFQAGNRTEQATILNSLLQFYLQIEAKMLNLAERSLQVVEEGVPHLERLIKHHTEDSVRLEKWRKELASAAPVIADRRAEVARHKKIAVIKWAK